MSTDQLKLELSKIEKAIGILESYKNRQVQDLSDDIKKLIFSIKVIPDITAGGLEECIMVLTHLYWARYLVNREITDRENPVKASATTPSISSTSSLSSASSTASPPATPERLAMAGVANEIKEKISTPVKPVATKIDSDDETPLDFGPFMPGSQKDNSDTNP